MPIRVQCSCGRAFPVAEAQAGQRAFCPMCGVQCLVPAVEGRGLGKAVVYAGGALLLAGAGFGAYWYFGRTTDQGGSTDGQGGSKVTFGEARDVPLPGNGGTTSPTPRDPGPRNPAPTGIPAEVSRRAQDLIAELDSSDEYARGRAARELVTMGPEIEPLLRDAAGRGVEGARLVLRALTWKRELPIELQTKYSAQIASLNADGDVARRRVIETWVATQDWECSPLLADLVEDDSAYVRQAAIEAAIVFRAPVSGAGIARFLSGDGKDARKDQTLGAFAAGLLGVTEAAPKLRPLLSTPGMRELAVTALGLLRDSESATEIAKDVNAASAIDRARAFKAIGRIGRFPGGFPIHAIGDPDAEVRAAIFVAAGRCREVSLRNQIAQLLAESDPRMRRAGAEALGEMGQDTAIANLMPLLSDTDPGVRYEVARALGRLRHRDAVAAFVGLLDDCAMAESASDDAPLRDLLEPLMVRSLRLSIPLPTGREVREGALLAIEECTGQELAGDTLDERINAARVWWAGAQPEYPR